MTRWSRAGSRAAGVAGAFVLAASMGLGCGNDDRDAAGPGMFDEQVAAVRAAVEAGDRASAEQALENLAVGAYAAHGEGAIDDDELAEIAALLDSSRAVLDDVLEQSEPPPPAPVASTAPPETAPPATAPPTTAPPAQGDGGGGDDDEDDDDDEDEDEGNGRGNGRGDKKPKDD